MNDLAKIIDKQVEGIAKSLGMPKIKTTSASKEEEKNRKRKQFRTRVFVILDDISATEYSIFINKILLSDGKIEIMREEASWTKDGELIRVIDFVEEK